MPQSTRLSYRDFSQKDIDSLVEHGVLNGIGPQKPEWLFWLLQKLQPTWLTNASGIHHDIYYSFGRNEIDRYNSDLAFYLMILQDARSTSPSYFWYIMRCIRAYIYYKAVRIGGYKRFYYSENYMSKEEVMELRYK